MDKILSEAKRLYDLGLAIHWLKPKDKAPVDFGWTKGPRKPWDALSKQYRKGMNVGVRLGTPSRLQGGYLYVIDCDVKSEEHFGEMNQALMVLKARLGIQGCAVPCVMSGRGNGSKHLYVLAKHPIKEKRLARSSEQVTVGNGNKNAWEIVLMGEGRQVVLPPSVHPESGKEYAWAIPLLEYTKIPFIDADKLAVEKFTREKRDKGFKFEVVDIPLEKLPEGVEAILLGGGGDDRSAALYGVLLQLIRADFSDNEILTLLTDPMYELSEVSYRHRKTEDRENAAHWLFEQNLTKAKRQAWDIDAFSEAVEITQLAPEDAEKQRAELLTVTDWRLKLNINQDTGKPKNTLNNCNLILENAFGSPIFYTNEFTARDHYAIDVPWRKKRGDELGEKDLALITLFFAGTFGFEPTEDKLFKAIQCVTDNHRIHPVRDYLNSLEWDGTERVDTWLKTYLGAEDEGNSAYLRMVSRKFLCAMIARIMVPGCKFDHILVLEGKQGVGKSTAAEILASREWFCDQLPDLRDKDARLNLIGAWVVELGELSSVRASDTESVKAFFSAHTDRVRSPYARFFKDVKRQNVFIGSTNSFGYLKDRSGNRRFWPVRVSGCEFEKLRRDRDQLLAEAKLIWEFGETINLTIEEQKLATSIQESREILTPEKEMEEVMKEFIENGGRIEGADPLDLGRFKMSDLFEISGPWGAYRHVKYAVQNGAEILKRLGFEKRKLHGQRIWGKPPEKGRS